MGGRSFHIGNDFGRIWCKKNLGGIVGDGSSSKNDDEENCALATKARKGKGNKSYSKFVSGKDGKKRNMSRVKCFHYHGHGNYATNCPQKKKNKKA